MALELTRRLSSMERGFVLLDRVRAFNGVPVLTVRGRIEEAWLRLAIERLQARHPLLRVRIAGDAARETPRYASDGVGPMSIEIVEREGDDHWQRIAERELNRAFPEIGPLTRFVWLRGDGIHDISFPQHHVTADAHTAIFQARDLLADLGRLAAGEVLAPVEELPPRPSLLELLPKEARGLRLLGTMTNFLFSNLATYAFGKPRKLVEGISLVGENRIVHRRVEPELMRRLVAHCKERNVTMHAVLCAALLRAASTEMGGSKSTMGCFSAINLRDKITLRIGEEQGLYISQVTTFHRMGDGRDVFELGRDVKLSMLRRLAAGDQYLTIPRMGMFIPRRGNVVERFARRIGGLSGAAVGVTNLGKVPLAPSYGPLTLERMFVSVGVSAVGHLSLVPSTYRDCLTLNFVYIEPLLTRAAVTSIADRVVEQLTSSEKLLGDAPRELPAAARSDDKSLDGELRWR